MCERCDGTGVLIFDIGYGVKLSPCTCEAWEKRKEKRDRELDEVLERLQNEMQKKLDERSES